MISCPNNSVYDSLLNTLVLLSIVFSVFLLQNNLQTAYTACFITSVFGMLYTL